MLCKHAVSFLFFSKHEKFNEFDICDFSNIVAEYTDFVVYNVKII